jgi:hypothetical protein
VIQRALYLNGEDVEFLVELLRVFAVRRGPFRGPARQFVLLALIRLLMHPYRQQLARKEDDEIDQIVAVLGRQVRVRCEMDRVQENALQDDFVGRLVFEQLSRARARGRPVSM